MDVDVSFSQLMFKHPRIKVQSQKKLSQADAKRTNLHASHFFSDTLTIHSFYRSDTLKSNLEANDTLSNYTCEASNGNNNDIIQIYHAPLIPSNHFSQHTGDLKKTTYLFHLNSLKHPTHLFKSISQSNINQNIHEKQLSKGVRFLLIMLWAITCLVFVVLTVIFALEGNLLWILFLILGAIVFFVPLFFFTK